MRYETFRDRLEQALRNAGVSFLELSRRETLELPALSRTYEVSVGLDSPKQADPFFVTAMIAFSWDPFQSARSYTTEEDLLTELFGRMRSTKRTTPRWQRIDMTFLAKPHYGSKMLTPDPRVLSTWKRSVERLLVHLVPVKTSEGRDGQSIAIGWRGEVEIRELCSPNGSLILNGIEIAAFQLVNPPRSSADPDRRDGNISGQLEQLARRFQTAFDGWMDLVHELGRKVGHPELEIE